MAISSKPLIYPEQIAPEHFVRVLNQVVARSNPLDPFWTKFQGELHFAAMNYPAALRSYIQTMALGTNFFLKPNPFSPDQGRRLRFTGNQLFSLRLYRFDACKDPIC